MHNRAGRGSSAADSKQLRPPLRGRLARGIGGVAVVGLATAVALSVTQPPPPELVAVETFADQGVEHIVDGTPTPEYNSDPPTSGPHAQAPAPCGIYRRPVPDVSQLHSMEHGAVVVHYDPGLDRSQIEKLEGIGRAIGDDVIVGPRADIPAPVVLTAWTKRLLMDEVDERVITGFDVEHGNRSPEAGAACPAQVDESTSR